MTSQPSKKISRSAAATAAFTNSSRPWLVPEVTIGAARLAEIEHLLQVELVDLSPEDQADLAKRTACIVASLGEAPPRSPAQAGVRGEHGAIVDQRQNVADTVGNGDCRNAPRNNIDLVLNLRDEHVPLRRLIATYGLRSVLASVALGDTLQNGRADSLISLLICLYRSCQEVFQLKPADAVAMRRKTDAMFEQMHQETRDVVSKLHDDLVFARDFIGKLAPDAIARARSKRALAGSRADGSNTNKRRAAAMREAWRRIAADLVRTHPYWGLQEWVVYIKTRTAPKSNGQPYSDATIRNALKGLRRDLRQSANLREL